MHRKRLGRPQRGRARVGGLAVGVPSTREGRARLLSDTQPLTAAASNTQGCRPVFVFSLSLRLGSGAGRGTAVCLENRRAGCKLCFLSALSRPTAPRAAAQPGDAGRGWRAPRVAAWDLGPQRQRPGVGVGVGVGVESSLRKALGLRSLFQVPSLLISAVRLTEK